MTSKIWKKYAQEQMNTTPFKMSALTFRTEKIDGWPIIIIPAGFSLFHGTTANWEEENSVGHKWLTDVQSGNIDAAFQKPFFVADNKTASKYGLSKDNSELICTYDQRIKILNDDKIKNTDVIPLYYIPGVHGVNLEFSVIRPIRVLNMNDEATIKKIYKFIQKLPKDDQSTYKEAMSYAFAPLLQNPNWKNPGEEFYTNVIKKIRRKSVEWIDKTVVELVCTHLNMDGWIYFGAEKKSTFHGEIMICKPNRENIKYITTHTVPDTVYPEWIPSIDEYKERFKNVTYDMIKNYQIGFLKKNLSITVHGGRNKPLKRNK
jgi:hypothetical protein